MAAHSISINSVDALRSDHMNNISITDENSLKDFSANCNWPMSTSVTPGTTQFAILYKGSMCVYDGIPAEKVHEIMLIAAASAKSTEMKSGIPFTSLIPNSPSSPQGTSTNLASPQSISFPVEKSPICRLQGGISLVIVYLILLIFCNGVVSFNLMWILFCLVQNFHWHADSHFKCFLRSEKSGWVAKPLILPQQK